VRFDGALPWHAHRRETGLTRHPIPPRPKQQRRRRYRKLTAEQLDRSRAESLKDAADRILPFWKSVVVPSIRAGNRCLVVSHANTIRTLIKHIDQISDEDIKSMTIPTGIPLLYRLDKNLRPVDPQVEMEFRYMVEPKGYVR
jgi:2,3-bisphosphoglycerate-dependent phosphoglycerate mutase